MADGLGRPVAILRLGARLPDRAEMSDPSFFFGSPPFVCLPLERVPAQPEAALAPSEQIPAPSGRVAAPSQRVETPKVKNLPPPPQSQEQPNP